MPTLDAHAQRRHAALGGLTAWAALLLQLVLTLQLSVANGRTVVDGVILYLGFFTILTNLALALVLTTPLVSPASTAGRAAGSPVVVTTVTAAIVVVGVAYVVLLRHVWDPQGWQLIADAALHYVTPVLAVTYWWGWVRPEGVPWTAVSASMVYPLSYLAYVLARGAAIGQYPYYFIDVGRLGYRAALTNAVGMTMAFAVVMAGLIAVSRRRSGDGLPR